MICMYIISCRRKIFCHDDELHICISTIHVTNSEPTNKVINHALVCPLEVGLRTETRWKKVRFPFFHLSFQLLIILRGQVVQQS